MSKETIEIKIELLTKQVNEGMKKDELAKFYDLPVSQMGKALKEAGLKIRKFHAPSFKLVSETEIVNPVTEEVKVDSPEDDAPTSDVMPDSGPESPAPTTESVWSN